MSNTGQTLLLTSITNYFEKNKCLKQCLSDVVNGKSVLSLRVIDWFVTHYTRSHNVIYWVDDHKNRLVETFPSTGGNTLRKVHLHLDYRAQLKSYTKLNFDPFRRHNRISFVIDTQPHTVIETTIGQLNFFRWCFQNHIIEYVCNHLTDIEAHMASFIQTKKSTGSVGTGEKKPEVAKNEKTIKTNKIVRKMNTNADIISAPCCLHFS